MSSRPCVHVVRDMPVTDAKGCTPLVTVDLRVFYPKTQSGFSGAATGLGIAYHQALQELTERYEEFNS